MDICCENILRWGRSGPQSAVYSAHHPSCTPGAVPAAPAVHRAIPFPRHPFQAGAVPELSGQGEQIVHQRAAAAHLLGEVAVSFEQEHTGEQELLVHVQPPRPV